MYLELEFMLVLPVARQREPRSKQAAISPRVFTSVSVTPAKVMPPLLVSLIWIGGFTTGPVLRPPPKANPAAPAPHWSSAGGGFGSRRSCTSSLRIWWGSPSGWCADMNHVHKVNTKVRKLGNCSGNICQEFGNNQGGQKDSLIPYIHYTKQWFTSFPALVLSISRYSAQLVVDLWILSHCLLQIHNFIYTFSSVYLSVARYWFK